MATVASQVINRYYEDYKNTEIIFSKKIMQTLKMDPRQIIIKCSGLQYSCIVNSSSFSQAKIIIGKKNGAYDALTKKDPPPISIRYCFYQPNGQSMFFFVYGKVLLIEPYMDSSDLVLITVQYTQRPPEDFISILGNLLDANINSVKRKEERIVINQETMRKLKLLKKELVISIQGVPRHCILQDLSFGGARVVLLGLAQYLLNKDVVINIEFEDPHETISISGVIVRTDFIEGRKDIISVSIKFNEESISLAYKIRINKYITTIRKTELDIHFADDNQEEPATHS